MLLKLRAVVKGGVLLINSLATDFGEEFSQRRRGIHMPPAFWHLGELDDRHRRGHLDTGLLPCAADAMAGDTKSIRPKGFGELSFDLPAKVTDNSRPEEVWIIHLLGSTSLDHLDVDLPSIFLN